MNRKICPVCKTQISRKWFWSDPGSKYVCSGCNSIISWKRSKRIRDGIIMFFGLIISSFVMTPYFFKLFGTSHFLSVVFSSVSAGVLCGFLLYISNLAFQNDIKVEVNDKEVRHD